MRVTMISYCPSTSATFSCLPLSHSLSSFAGGSKKNHHFLLQNPSSCYFIRKPKTSGSLVCLSVGPHEIAEIAHNKVLVAAGVSAAIGQLSKPFTSALLYQNDLDFDFKKWVFGAGGFPSVHSAGVVAAAASLGLERGFSDSVFGVAVVFACIVMYDAQGVRREVGNHAEVLNKIELLSNKQNNSISNKNKDGLLTHDSNSGTSSSVNSEFLAPLLNSISEKKSSKMPNTTNPEAFLRSENISSSSSRVSSIASTDDNEVSNGAVNKSCSVQLRESIGHTEIEVIAGAFLGFLISLAVYTIV